MNKNGPFWGKQVVSIKNKGRKTQKKKKLKTKHREGLGPSEAALWATSPDP